MSRFWQRHLGGHLSIGSLTIYGENAMHWGVNYWTKRWGYICFRLPFRCFGKWWPLYFYLSPNATPWASTFYLGRGHEPGGSRSARRRLAAFGHGFDAELHSAALHELNDQAWEDQWKREEVRT